METFARSSATLFAKANVKNKPLSPLKSLPGRSEICFSRCLNSNVHDHRTFLLRHKALQSVAPSQTEVLTTLETAGIGIQTTEPSETVHVQFQLHKECKFGESFLLVGNEPLMGEWNPTSAMPLNWSDGNIWTAELDVPIGIAIQYKFILKKRTGDLLWQPGPDRILHTWNAKYTIAIAEDWKDSELQKISEVQIANQNEVLLVNPDIGPIVPGNATHPGEELMLNVTQGVKFSDSITSPDDKPRFSVGNNEFIIEEKAIKSADGTLLGVKKEVRVSDDGIMKEESIRKTTPTTITSKIPLSVRYEDEETLPPYEGGPVLVPGLNPIQGVAYEEALPKEIGNSMSAEEALPKEFRKFMSSEEALTTMSSNELGKPMSSEEALPKQLGKSMPFEEALPKEHERSMSSKAALPNELGQSMSSEEALPRELRKTDDY